MKHDGVYELKIKSSSGVSDKKFTVTVREREIPVKEGDSLTLNTETEIQKDDLILWRFEENLIAQIKEGKRETFDDVLDGRFRGRLTLDEKTGSLTITDMRDGESGLYKLQIISSRGNTDRSFSVTVWEKQVSVYEGDPVTLVTDTEIHSEDQIQCVFEEKNSEINGGIREITCDGADDRLKLDKTTGSLTIRNTRKTDSGLYKLQIKTSRGVYYRKIRVHVAVRMVAVEEGKPLTLNTETEIQKDNQILWKFKEMLIAQIKGGTGETFDDVPDERFRGRLKLDEKTGDLMITDMRDEHSGVYDLQIISSRGTTDKRFRVVVINRGYSDNKVMEGDDVTLPSSTSLKGDEIVHWLFNDETISTGMNKDINKTSYLNVRFGDRLQLDHQTGSLTIKNTRTSDTGDYHLKLLKCGIERKFKVTVREREIPVTEGEPLTLNTETEIQTDDLILLMFGGNLIAHFKGGSGETFDDVLGGRFRDRLKLDEETGSLTITDMRYGESGLYKLQIISSRGNTDRSFSVNVKEREIPVKRGETVTLKTDTEIQREDLIQWVYRGNLIAQIKEGTGETFDKVAGGSFRGRLKLDEKTGSLTITDMRIRESGRYKLQIFSRRGTTDKRFSVKVWGIIPSLPPPPRRPLEEDMILQQDNATSHTARSVRKFLHDSNVSVLPWPAKILDLNPIEHVWDLLDCRLRTRAIPPINVQELASALVEEWERRVNESATALKPQSNKEIRDGEKESVTVVMPLLSDVEERQETSSL
ncbi:contactin-3 [Pseudorasbora parva]|uniref:contactin-3 n=1 Tax=Pseudorasbora parva TaxID=51549 RepID=UPI00351F0738